MLNREHHIGASLRFVVVCPTIICCFLSGMLTAAEPDQTGFDAQQGAEPTKKPSPFREVSDDKPDVTLNISDDVPPGFEGLSSDDVPPGFEGLSDEAGAEKKKPSPFRAASDDNSDSALNISDDVPPGFEGLSDEAGTNKEKSSPFKPKSGNQADSKMKVHDDVPAGFENLAGPQTNLVDLIFNGSMVGTVTVTGNDEFVTFEDPEEVVALLSGLLAPDDVMIALYDEYPSNVDKVCYGPEDPAGCGSVVPEPIAVIYDAGALKLELFLSGELQELTKIKRVRHLPRPERRYSSIFSVYGVATAIDDREPTIDFSTQGLFGYGASNLSIHSDVNTSSKEFHINELVASHHFNDSEIRSGFFGLGVGGGLSDIRVMGFSYFSSLRARTDLDQAFSTPVTVYLVRRSVVQISVGGRIISGDTYEAGNQMLDTRALPDGNYELELTIIDPVVGTSIEKRMFTKSTDLPPIDGVLSSFSAGFPILDDSGLLPKYGTSSVINGSWAFRVADNAALKLGLSHIGDLLLGYAEFLYLGEQSNLQITATEGVFDTRALSVRANFTRKSLMAEFSLEQFRSRAALDENAVSQLPADYMQAGFSLNKSFKENVLGVSIRHRSERDEDDLWAENYQYALFFRRPLFKRNSFQGFIDSAYENDGGSERITLQTRIFLDKQGWVSGAALAFDRTNDEPVFHSLNLDSNWNTTTESGQQLALSGFASQSTDDESIGGKVKLEASKLHASVASEWGRHAEQAGRVSSVANVAMHVGHDKNGAALGGADYAQSGMIVDVKGEPAGEPFDILINGAVSGSSRIGQSQFIGLQPFESYSVKLLPRGVLSNGMGETIYQFTLFPGNIKRVELNARRIILVVAEVVTEEGELINSAVVELDNNPLIIENGLFQGELPVGVPVEVRPHKGPKCMIMAPDDVEDDVYIPDDPLVCEQI